VKWYIEVMRKYAVFSGRARRLEYWMFVLSNVIIAVVLSIIDGIADSDSEGSRSTLTTLYGLAILIPSLAVSVRRLHDTGRSGWWMLIGLIPIIGTIVLLIFIIQDSQLMDNQYGPNPKREITPYQRYSVSRL
jgi:uncharacterized membrane protein YhaH (DUF805 family)